MGCEYFGSSERNTTASNLPYVSPFFGLGILFPIVGSLQTVCFLSDLQLLSLLVGLVVLDMKSFIICNLMSIL